jgi:polyadenylation factor subunit 2
VTAIAVSKYDKYNISGDQRGEIVYSNAKLSQKNKFTAHSSRTKINDLSFAPSSMKFVSCSEDNTAKIFDFATAREEFSFAEHKNNVQSCEWHPFLSLVITGSKD